MIFDIFVSVFVFVFGFTWTAGVMSQRPYKPICIYTRYISLCALTHSSWNFLCLCICLCVCICHCHCHSWGSVNSVCHQLSENMMIYKAVYVIFIFGACGHRRYSKRSKNCLLCLIKRISKSWKNTKSKDSIWSPQVCCPRWWPPVPWRPANKNVSQKFSLTSSYQHQVPVSMTLYLIWIWQ